MAMKIKFIFHMFILNLIIGCIAVNLKDPKIDSESLGTSYIKMDGTIALSLRAESLNGKDVGELQFEYQISDPYYSKVLELIGGIERG